jgi:hypothetical protein
VNIVFSFYGIMHCLGWPLTVNERSNKAKHEAMNSYQISPAHVFVANAYGHCVGSIINDTNPHRTANRRKLSQQTQAQLSQSLLASLKRDHGIGCPDFGYSQTHKSSAQYGIQSLVAWSRNLPAVEMLTNCKVVRPQWLELSA